MCVCVFVQGVEIAKNLKLAEGLAEAKAKLAKVEAPAYLKSLEGTLGVDPSIVAALPKTPA